MRRNSSGGRGRGGSLDLGGKAKEVLSSSQEVRRDRRRCPCRRPSRRSRGRTPGRLGSSGRGTGRARCTARPSASSGRSGSRGVDVGAAVTSDGPGGPSSCRTAGGPTTTTRGGRPGSGGPTRALAPSCSGSGRT